MFCNKCGKECSSNAKFCPYCGTVFNKKPPVTEAAEKQENPKNPEKPGKPKKTKTVIIIACAAAAFVIAAAVLSIILISRSCSFSDNSKGSESGLSENTETDLVMDPAVEREKNSGIEKKAHEGTGKLSGGASNAESNQQNSTDTSDTLTTAPTDPAAKYHTVTFLNFDGTVIESQSVEDGKSAKAPPDPVKARDNFYDYKFVRWGLDFSHVTSDMYIAPEFEPVLKPEYQAKQ